jgi:two-component system, NarL family, nitrate/nitrite response regulator NarL
MRVLLIGTDEDRARVRAMLLGRGIEVVAEAATLSEGRALEVGSDAVILASAANEDGPIEALTPRELEVLDALAGGLSNKAIAARLGITEHTVKFHVAAICGKLGAENRTDAVRRGVRLGLVAL